MKSNRGTEARGGRGCLTGYGRWWWLSGLILAGCAELPRAPSPVAGASVDLHRQHAAQIASFEQWRLRGRLAVQRADQGFSADLDWRQAPTSFVLRVTGPLSSGTFALTGGSAGVSMVTPKGETDTAGNAEELMRRHLGWSLPLAGVRYWVRGLPDPADAATQERWDERGRWTEFNQTGWHIQILEYHEDAGLALPARLFLSRADLQVRMAVKQWEQH